MQGNSKKIIFTVTNDLNYDQRMMRICTSLTQAGYRVILIGVKRKSSLPLEKKIYSQQRMSVIFTKGFLFYCEYNFKLFFQLFFQRFDAICCIDLDTILPVYFQSIIRNKIRIYDAHEYFSQLKEVVFRPIIYKFWHFLESSLVPRFKLGYTVSESISKEFFELYHVQYLTIRNVPVLKNDRIILLPSRKNILYQGSVNEARGFEVLIPAMQNVDSILEIYGDGNFLEKAKVLVKKYRVENKVFFMGKKLPEQLDAITSKAYIGINLVEKTGLNQYYSLANKFFDYIHHQVPQVTMNFPEYKKINDEYEVALLIDELNIESVTAALQRLLADEELYQNLKTNTIDAAKKINWQTEEKKLIGFYNNLLG